MATLIEQAWVGVCKFTNPETGTDSPHAAHIYPLPRLPSPAHKRLPRHGISKPSGALEAPHCGANDGHPNRTSLGWGLQIHKPRNRDGFAIGIFEDWRGHIGPCSLLRWIQPL